MMHMMQTKFPCGIMGMSPGERFFEPDISGEISKQLAQLSMGPDVTNYGGHPLELRRRSNSVDEFSVIALDDINAGAYLGDIHGDRKYVWEVTPSEWTFFIDDECIIDMTATPRDINAYVHEDFYEGLEPNCTLVRFGRNGYMHVGFRTLEHICAGEELVYRRSQELWIDVETEPCQEQ